MSVIYEAKQIDDNNKKVVIKIFNSQMSNYDEISKRFEDKIKIIQSFEHKNIALIKEYVFEPNLMAIITDLIVGQNLKFAVSMKDFSKDQNIDYFKQIVKAVSYGHSLGIAHRDLRPSNIFFTNDYKMVKILDFGLAEIFEYDNPKKLKMDTPMFLSPEQVAGSEKIDFRTDIYTLGVILYNMLSKKPPYPRTTSYDEICEQIINQDVPETERYTGIDRIIKKATAKKPEERFQSCDEFLKAID
jgi:serine/threonine-protein kinase